VVTGTSPLAGARDVARYHLPLEGLTQMHADIGWLLGGLMVALLLGLRLAGAPRRAVRLAWLLAGRNRVRAVLLQAGRGPGVGPRGRLDRQLDRRAVPALPPPGAAGVFRRPCRPHRPADQHHLFRQRRRRPRHRLRPRLPDGPGLIRDAGSRSHPPSTG
jgi:hypothetical protein